MTAGHGPGGASPGGASPGGASPGSTDAPPTILVVDDEPLNRDLVCRSLARRYELLEAGEAQAALRLLEAHPRVAVLVCDHLMPGRSGTELAEDVHARWPHAVTVLLTGYDDAPEVTAARASGAVWDVLAKPFDVRALAAVVARAVIEHERRRA